MNDTERVASDLGITVAARAQDAPRGAWRLAVGPELDLRAMILDAQLTVGSSHVPEAPAVTRRQLLVGEADDPLEAEAELVANAVTAWRGQLALSPDRLAPAAAGSVQRCGAIAPESCPCHADTVTNRGQAPPIVDTVLASPGQRLTPDLRVAFESRLSADFGEVRLHTDELAARSAAAVGAHAYTVGRDVVFGAGKYAPATDAGVHILAHELTHVVQQQRGLASGGGPSGPEEQPGVLTGAHLLQRFGDVDLIPVGLRCPIADTSPAAAIDHITFPNAVATLTALDREQIASFINNWRAAGANQPIRVDGFASVPGGQPLNWRLSCERARNVASELMSPASGAVAGVPSHFVSIYMQGETNEFGPEAENRRVTLAFTLGSPTTTRPPAPTSVQHTANTCPADWRSTVDADRTRAIDMMDRSISLLGSYDGTNPAAVATAMNDHFHTTSKWRAVNIKVNLSGVRRLAPVAAYDCADTDPSNWWACTGGDLATTFWAVPGVDIRLCSPGYFRQSDRERSTTLIHEWMHKYWGSLDLGYRGSPEYTSASTIRAMLNADPYAQLCKDLT